MNDRPFVVCIMPTRNRPGFVERAIDLFLAQDYPNKRLLILEEESCSVTTPQPSNVIYIGSSELLYRSIGEKRNTMCELVGDDADLIAHWDDDDWNSPRRLSTQIEAMRAQGARLCGMDRLIFYNGERAWLFQTVRKPWLAGGTLVYERSLWVEQPFNEVSDGEDTAFIDAAVSRAVKIATLTDESLYVAMLHNANTTKRDVSRLGGNYEVATVQGWMK